MKRSLSAALVCMLLAAFAPPALAAPAGPAGPAGIKPIVLTPADLGGMGIRTRALRLSNISTDGRVTVLTEKERDPRLKAKGQVWKLRVFHLGPGASKPRLTTIWLPTTDKGQVWLSPDGTRALVVSDRGTRLIGVDLVKGLAHVIFRHTRGEPSFRVIPELVWFEKGRFHTLGYFMDAKEIATGDFVVAVDVEGRGFWAIHKVRDIAAMLKLAKGSEYLWHSSETTYTSGKTDKNQFVLAAWLGEKVVAIEKADGFGAFAAGENRLIYPSRTGQTHSLTIYDTAQDKKWKLGDGKAEYTYPYMSADGKTVLASTFDRKAARMSVYYATESDDFTLHPIPALTNVPMGAVRFSGNGRVVAIYSEKGLQWVTLPAPTPVPQPK